jgi:hypothetical protein
MPLKWIKFASLLAAAGAGFWWYGQKSAQTESLDSENVESSRSPKTPVSRFTIPTDPKLARLRSQLMKPWKDVDTESKAFVQQSAMSDLSRMRTREAAFVLAELLFADPKEYYTIEFINGVEAKSVSYSVMIYLEKMLENSPPPLDGHNFADADLPVWQEWWNSNKDKLIFREVKNSP